MADRADINLHHLITDYVHVVCSITTGSNGYHSEILNYFKNVDEN